MSEQGPQPREIDWAKIIETALTAPGNVGNVYNGQDIEGRLAVGNVIEGGEYGT